MDGTNNKTILLVEDEAIIAMMEKSQLEEEGYGVVHVLNGEKAIDIVRTHNQPIDLVLMDIDLGKGMDGTETAKEILNEFEVPVVFLSSHSEKEIVDKTEKITSFGYVMKNSGNTVLSASIKMAFKLFEAQKNIKEQKIELLKQSQELQEIIEELQATNEEFESINEQLLQSEQELLKSESFLNSIIDQSPDPMWISDGTGTLIRINNSCLNILKLKPDDVIGKYNVLKDNIIAEQGFLPLVKNVFEKGEAVQFELIYDTSRLKNFALPDHTSVILEVHMFPIRDPRGKITNAVIHHTDITGRKRTEDELKRSQAQYRLLIDNLPNTSVLLFDHDFRFIIAGGEEISKSGFDRDLVEGHTLAEAFTQEVVELFTPLYTKALAGEKTVFEQNYKDLAYLQQVLPVRDELGNIRAGMVISHNITERKRIMEDLKASEHKMRSHLAETPVGVIEWDIDFRVSSWNPAAEKIFGYSAAEALGRHASYFLPESAIPQIDDIWNKLMSHTGGQKNINENIRKNGRTIICEWHNTTLTSAEGRVIGAASIVQDITEQKSIEEKIFNLLHEKEIILKDAHHRIKNNMSTIISLLNIQAEAQNNPMIENILLDAAGRVRSMRVLYDKLYHSEIKTTLNIKEYIPSLVNEIISVFPHKRSVKIISRIDEINLNSSLLSTVGLIINELISNAMKYAFSTRGEGIITIIASKRNGRMTLRFEDNGSGLPESITIENSTGFGLQLVGMLVHQINGTITIERDRGTQYIIEFVI